MCRMRGNRHKKNCSRCGKTFNKNELASHRKACPWTRCRYCGRRKLLGQPHTCVPSPTSKLQCSRCGRYFKSGEVSGHQKACQWKKCNNCFKHTPLDQSHDCYRCYKAIKPGDFANHQESCQWRKCRHCYRRKPPGEIHDCPKKPPPQPLKRACKQCRKRFPVDRIDEHTKECKFTKCLDCQISLPEVALHDCPGPTSKCKGCCGRFPTEEINEHIKECKFRKCPACEKVLALGTFHNCPKKDHIRKKQCSGCAKSFLPDAVHICQFKRCSICLTPASKNEYPRHKRACSAVLCEKRNALRSTGCCSWLTYVRSAPCPHPKIEGHHYCKKHADLRNFSNQFRKNTEAEQQRFRYVLLGRHGKWLDWQHAALSESARRWVQQPKNVAICDIEACSGGRMMSPLNVFEVAIANAEGQWIIPPTIIHHQMTKRELFAANVESLRNEAAFSKFYGDADETEARGMGERTATWRELGQELEAYLKREGAIVTWCDWSHSNFDWRGLYTGLASVGFEQLLPPEPSEKYRPLLWWRKIRNALGLHELSLNQGNLFEILYPEDTELLSQAHYAGPDVRMLRKILQYLFSGLENSPIPRKIENFVEVIYVKPSGDDKISDEKHNQDWEEENSDDENSDEARDQPPRKRTRRS